MKTIENTCFILGTIFIIIGFVGLFLNYTAPETLILTLEYFGL